MKPLSTRLPKGISFWIFSGLALLALAAVLWPFFPLPPDLFHPASKTMVLLDIKGRLIEEAPLEDARSNQPLALKEMGPWLPTVTVALEDHRFFEHRGVDFRSLAGAAWRDLRSGGIVAGASTITQQVIKLASRRQGRAVTAKLYEIPAAVRLEELWSKDRILEEYLNRSHYANRRVGPAAAAQAYFGKKAADLTLAEAIFLAGLPQAPSRFNPWTRAPSALGRYRRSVHRLLELNVVTADQADRLLAAPPAVGRFIAPSRAPHFVDAVLNNSNLDRHASPVRTTLDLDLQSVAEALVRDHVQASAVNGAAQAALVVIDNATGGIRALVGSPDYAAPQGQINGAFIARSSGSVLKPFVYLAALDQKSITAATLLPDTNEAIRDEYIDYQPVNYDRRFHGPVRAREALASSLNVPAVGVLHRVGARRAYQDLRDWGFHFPRAFSEYGAGLVLGNGEIRLVDLAAAYAGLARGGVAMDWQWNAAAGSPAHRVASEEACAIIKDILGDNEARRLTFGHHSPLEFDAFVPVKTGTSSGFRDGWAVGMTAEHTVAVWAGNFDGRPMRQAGSVRSAAPLWRAMVEHLLKEDHPLPTLAARAGANPSEAAPLRVTSREICSLSGLLPCPDSPATKIEWFLPGTEPAQRADAFFQRKAGGAGTEILLPPEYAGWCASSQNDLGARCLDPDLRILSPRAGAVYQREPLLSPAQQTIEFVSNQPDAALEWQINGRPLQPTQGRFLWRLEAGEHRVVVSNGRQHTESSFRVEPTP